jgi:hypothetical protein
MRYWLLAAALIAAAAPVTAQTAEPITEEWVMTTPDGPKVLAAFREEVARFRAERR